MRSARGSGPGIKFLPEQRIERAALDLLCRYANQFGFSVTPPIPVEEIVESHLGLDLRLEDLQGRKALGGLRVRKRQVVVEQSLDPTIYPEREGRYRFTVGHEAGHWELHRHLVAPAEQSSLAMEEAEPSIICRAGPSTDRKEWQANQFAAYLLMPRDMIIQAWQARRGEPDPYVAADEIADLSARWCLGEDETPTVEIARDLAREFNVSGRSMQIRLVRMGLIVTSKAQPSLFFGEHSR
jgi:hypothetical protein